MLVEDFVSGKQKMKAGANELELLLGRAALQLWPDLPRDVQERLFDTAVPLDASLRNHLAISLHNLHPRTAHPPKPTDLA
jgi:hypothetical protein